MNQKDKIVEIFFGFSSGDLPDYLISTKEQYLEERGKIEVESACFKCSLPSLMRRYKRIVLDKIP